MSPTDIHRVADLKLRGPAGKIPVRVRWPVPDPPGAKLPLIVLLPDAAADGGVQPPDDELAGELCAGVGAVVLCTPWAPGRPGALDRADATLLWAADHGAELGADPSRLAVVGRGAGAAGAAALGLRARERGWPRLQSHVLLVADGTARAATQSPCVCALQADVYAATRIGDVTAGLRGVLREGS